MVTPEALYPDVYTDTFIFFLRSLYKIIWMNVHYFPNAPRIDSNAYAAYFKGPFIQMFIGCIDGYSFNMMWK